MTASERQQFHDGGGITWTVFHEDAGWAWMPIPPRDFAINLIQSTNSGILRGFPNFTGDLLTSVTSKLLWTQAELDALNAIENIEDYASLLVLVPDPVFGLPNATFSDSLCQITRIDPDPNSIDFGDEWDLDFVVTFRVNSGIRIPTVPLFVVLGRYYEHNEFIV
jgi:hypothetical protein